MRDSANSQQKRNKFIHQSCNYFLRRWKARFGHLFSSRVISFYSTSAQFIFEQFHFQIYQKKCWMIKHSSRFQNGILFLRSAFAFIRSTTTLAYSFATSILRSQRSKQESSPSYRTQKSTKWLS